jgi:hypothetical protein
MDAMETLKTMIRSWLDETYPTMPEEQRAMMARDMDMSMIERKKEESMKTFYEINNVVRMSFIEMQYMKKVSLSLKVSSPLPRSDFLQMLCTGNDERAACHG